MKKLTLSIMTAFLMLTFIPTQMKAVVSTESTSIPAPKTDASAETNALINRLDEIKAMDKSNLNSADKKQLRKEVRSIKADLKRSSGGIYLSVGAAIIIVLLLILLL